VRRKDAAIAGGLLGALAGLAADALLDGGRPLLHSLAGGVAGAVAAGLGTTDAPGPLEAARALAAAKAGRIAAAKGASIDPAHLDGLLRPMDGRRLALLARYLDAYAARDTAALAALLPRWEAEMPDALRDPGWGRYRGILFT
jgi:hypothetical protein